MVIKQYLYLGVLLAFVAVGATAGYYKWKSDAQAVDVLQAQVERDNAKAEVKALTKKQEQAQKEIDAYALASKLRDEELERLRKDKERTDALLRKAIEANRTWSDTPVPPGVRDSLKDNTN